MTDVVPVLLVLLSAYYAGVIGLFAAGFVRVRRRRPAGDAAGAAPFVSVVVAARNEEAGIRKCLESILDNDYPEDRYEVIVVDDGSTDATASIVRRLQRRYAGRMVAVGGDPDSEPHRLRLLTLPEGVPAGKQRALARGIEAARGTWILTTDADCVARTTWLQRMASYMTDDTAFISGPVAYWPGRTLFERMQGLEFLGLVAVGGGAIGLGRPILCNSANIAYRRDVYDQFARLAPEHPVHPGDDEVLIQRIAAETDWRVAFCADPEALILTNPLTAVSDFMEQRRRWARGAMRYPSLALFVQLAALYAFFIALLGTTLAALFVPSLLPIAGLMWALKMAAELAVLVPAARHFGQVSLLGAFVPAQLFHAPYLVYAVAAGAFGQTRWKGRAIP